MEPTKRTKRISLLSLLGALLIGAVIGLYAVTNAAADGTAAQDDAAAKSQADGAGADTTDEPQADGETDGADPQGAPGNGDGDAKAGDEPAPIPVRTVNVEEGRVSSYLSATANLVAENEVRIMAEWEGRLADLSVEEGRSVGRGDVLAVLAQTDAKIVLEKAQVRAADAAQRHARMRQLADQELISNDEYEKARLEDQVAAQELAEAEWRLEKTRIRAPFAGRITERMTQVGQHIRPGDELFVLTDFDPLVARIYLPEKDVLGLEEGRDVRIALKADETIGVDGRIRQISPVVDTATGTVKVTVEAIRPPREVRPGAFVRVDVVRETRPDAILVPREAIVRELQRTYVFVADDGFARKRAVTLGIEEDERIEALEGVAVGERVIVAGQGGLEDGAPIKTLDEAPETPTAVEQIAAR